MEVKFSMDLLNLTLLDVVLRWVQIFSLEDRKFLTFTSQYIDSNLGDGGFIQA